MMFSDAEPSFLSTKSATQLARVISRSGYLYSLVDILTLIEAFNADIRVFFEIYL